MEPTQIPRIIDRTLAGRIPKQANPADEKQFRRDPDKLRKQLVADACEWLKIQLGITRDELVAMMGTDDKPKPSRGEIDEQTLTAMATTLGNIQRNVRRLARNERRRIKATPQTPNERPTTPKPANPKRQDGNTMATNTKSKPAKRPKTRPRIDREEIRAVVRLYHDEQTPAQMAAGCGCSLSTIQRAIREYKTGEWRR